MNGHRILRKLERAGLDPKTNKGGKPVACAITGTCMGIGTEIALACHRRFMADDPKARIGLPEILVGIFPGGGGTTRYSRMVGAMAAAPVLLEGKTLDPKKGQGRQPRGRGRACGRPDCPREGMGSVGHRRRYRQAVGSEGLEDAPAAHPIIRRAS